MRLEIVYNFEQNKSTEQNKSIDFKFLLEDEFIKSSKTLMDMLGDLNTDTTDEKVNTIDMSGAPYFTKEGFELWYKCANYEKNGKRFLDFYRDSTADELIKFYSIITYFNVKKYIYLFTMVMGHVIRYDDTLTYLDKIMNGDSAISPISATTSTTSTSSAATSSDMVVDNVTTTTTSADVSAGTNPDEMAKITADLERVKIEEFNKKEGELFDNEIVKYLNINKQLQKKITEYNNNLSSITSSISQIELTNFISSTQSDYISAKIGSPNPDIEKTIEFIEKSAYAKKLETEYNTAHMSGLKKNAELYKEFMNDYKNNLLTEKEITPDDINKFKYYVKNGNYVKELLFDMSLDCTLYNNLVDEKGDFHEENMEPEDPDSSDDDDDAPVNPSAPVNSPNSPEYTATPQ